MQELIRISDEQTISARELHEYLEVETPYTQWFDRMIEYGFSEIIDYVGFSQKSDKPQGGRPSIDHEITIDMAKEICMLQRSEKGKQARLYFIEAEKQSRQPKIMTQAEIIAASAQQLVIMETSLKALDTKINNAVEIFTKPIAPSWKDGMNTIINGIVQNKGLNYQTFKSELYSELDRVAKCDVGIRQTRLRARMKQAGHTSAEQKTISKLDIVERDPKLKNIFEGIVRKYQAKYLKV